MKKINKKEKVVKLCSKVECLIEIPHFHLDDNNVIISDGDTKLNISSFDMFDSQDK